MRRIFMPGLIALVALTIYVQASSAPPAQQQFRMLEFSRTGPWEVAAISSDEKVNHCALTRGTSSADLKPGEPKFLMIVDTTWMVVRVRDASYKFSEKKKLDITAITAEGVASTPAAATGPCSYVFHAASKKKRSEIRDGPALRFASRGYCGPA
jgi:hypothetical protein